MAGLPRRPARLGRDSGGSWCRATAARDCLPGNRRAAKVEGACPDGQPRNGNSAEPRSGFLDPSPPDSALVEPTPCQQPFEWRPDHPVDLRKPLCSRTLLPHDHFGWIATLPERPAQPSEVWKTSRFFGFWRKSDLEPSRNRRVTRRHGTGPTVRWADS